MDNIQLFKKLLAERRIALCDSPLLHSQPKSYPRVRFERIEGMLLGIAIGDGLGNTSESLAPPERRRLVGEICDYLPNRHAGNRRVGVPSDDTQLTFWSLEQIIQDRGLVPDHLARRFTLERIFGIGGSVRDFLHAYKDLGTPWDRAGQPSAGNGALMRIAPLLIPHLKNPSPALWADAALGGMLTHNDAASNAACVAFIHLLYELLDMDAVPPAAWWLETFCAWFEALEGETRYRAHWGSAYEGSISGFVHTRVGAALEEDLGVLDACESWGSGAYLMETLPSMIYILARHAADPEEALLRAVNDTRDNDTIAAVVGAALGALHGRRAFPQRWMDGLTGRTGADDDGRIYELLGEMRQVLL